MPTERLMRAGRPRQGDEGVSLVLVLVFMLVCGIIIGALATAASDDLLNSGNFKSARNFQTALSDAVDVAIQDIRTTPLLSETFNAPYTTGQPGYCWGTGPTSTYSNSGYNISVFCSTEWQPWSANTRIVTVSACQGGTSASACASAPLLQAQVTFDDFPAGSSNPTGSDSACTTYCGTGMSIDSWTSNPAIPTVTGVSDSTGSPVDEYDNNLQQITVTGKNFVPNETTVDFVEELDGVPYEDTTYNYCSTPCSPVGLWPATGVSVNATGTSLTATPPAVIDSPQYQYFVTVTTPGGTSVDGSKSSSDVVTYPAPSTLGPSPQLTATGITPKGGYTSGSTGVTITGTGFMAGDTVSFVDTNTSDGNAPLAAQDVVVQSSTTITALSPPIYEGAGANYYVEVTAPCPSNPAPPGCGGSTSGAAGTTFTYALGFPELQPLSSGNSGPAGTQITLTGSNFYEGMSVNFYQDNNGTAGTTAYPGTAVDVVSASMLTVDVPCAGTGIGCLNTYSTGATYFIEASTSTTNFSGTNDGGVTASSSGIVFSYSPTASFGSAVSSSATANPPGTTVTITGSDFVHGGTNVLFNSTAGPTTVAATVASATQLTAAVPTGCTATATCTMQVETNGGNATLSPAVFDLVISTLAYTTTGTKVTITTTTPFETGSWTVAVVTGGTTVSCNTPTLSNANKTLVCTTASALSGTKQYNAELTPPGSTVLYESSATFAG